MKSQRRKPAPKLDVDGPAVITALHVLDRPATDSDGKPIMGTRAWRLLTPLQQAYGKGQLKGGSPRFTADERYSAGTDYTSVFDAAERPGRDSTQALNVIRGGSGGSPGMAQAKAASELACIHSHLGHRDRQIIALVCGDGYQPPIAIKRVLGADYKKAALARFRETLDSLCEAMDAARRRPGEIDMRRRA